MTSFKPELCVLRKTKPEHYDLKQVRNFAKESKFSAVNMKLNKKQLCGKLIKKYKENQGGPSIVSINKNSELKKEKVTISKKIKSKNSFNKKQQKQKKKVLTNLMKYHKNRNYKYKPILKQLKEYQRNPMIIGQYSEMTKNLVLLQFGDIPEDFYRRKHGESKIYDSHFLQAVLDYSSFKNNPNILMQSISVPKTWGPSIGKNNCILNPGEKVLTCSLKPAQKLTIDTCVYIDIETNSTDNNKNQIQHVYSKKNLVSHMEKFGNCPGKRWKQLTPNNIKKCHPAVFEDLDVKGLLYVRELQKIKNNDLLIAVEKMLGEVHTIHNKHKVVIHAITTNNVKERRGNCGLSIIQLYDYIQEQKTRANKYKILHELGQSLPVCIEAKCNFIREFVEMKRSGLKFNYNSGITKDGNISNAVLFFIKKWCGEASKKSKPKEYFLGKLPDLFTRVQALLQNKNARNGRIDYTDILKFIMDNGEYMLNCENLNFNNIQLNTEAQKRELFGMRGIR